MTPVLVATDLDGTVLFSDRAMGTDRPAPERLRPIDVVGDHIYAYMTDTVVDGWTRLAHDGAVLPATTRSVDQYTRLQLPGRAPRYAVVCNGARILVDGSSDPDWERRVRTALRGAAPYTEVERQCSQWRDQHAFASSPHSATNQRLQLRSVEDFFVYFTVTVREDWLVAFAGEVASWCTAHGWRASLQGRKLYVLPEVLDKATAVAEVAARTGAGRVVAGGDSLLDEGMLRSADAAIRPAHGELAVTGYTAPNCRTTAGRGAAAGDEIMEWYATELGTHRVARIA
jgi:hydroxymethylpyrimidine pyrophosphatase-like HAD family hydrolase